MASKLDAIAAEYNHLLASQLDSQRHYYEVQRTAYCLHACVRTYGSTASSAQRCPPPPTHTHARLWLRCVVAAW